MAWVFYNVQHKALICFYTPHSCIGTYECRQCYQYYGSTYTSSLMGCWLPVCDPLREGQEMLVTKTLRAVVASQPRSLGDLTPGHHAEDINHYHLPHHLTNRQEVSCTANGCSLHLNHTHLLNMCARLPVPVARAPASRPSMTSQSHIGAWVTGGLFAFQFKTESISCAPFV